MQALSESWFNISLLQNSHSGSELAEADQEPHIPAERERGRERSDLDWSQDRFPLHERFPYKSSVKHTVQTGLTEPTEH